MSTLIDSGLKEQLDRIETSILSKKDVLTFVEFCNYVGIGESYGYRLTSQKQVPHYNPRGKQLYFNRAEIDEWLMQNPVKTATQIAEEVKQYDQHRQKGKTSHGRA
ncbi:helix-turn-helix domain-containing protein [Spirosoma pollinicola]|uniref:DNA-binding protein n=1 Tax=Spirosoma pollinicola TaxID=2057025 RepID=A0A2K8Z0D3_9BACT|nr:helix-turn-helix domain-containing protein [Spirosoma pollinicola]AUD03268.1 DNA-binding protein [Spirosoma pollinicola]